MRLACRVLDSPDVSAVPVVKTYYEVMDDRAEMLGHLKSVLEEVGADHALIGGIAAGFHGRPRATIDVDFLVPGRKLAPLARALEARGFVVARHLPDMIRVLHRGAEVDPTESIADLVSKDANPVLKAAFKEVTEAEVLGHRVRMIKRGAFVALKFHAAVSSQRRLGDRYQDVVDIERVVAKHFDADDEKLSQSIARHMFPGACEDLHAMIEDLRAGRQVKL